MDFKQEGDSTDGDDDDRPIPDEQYKKLQKYLPLIEIMIKNLSQQPGTPREAQLQKLKHLRMLFVDKKKFKVSTAKKCEMVMMNFKKVLKGPLLDKFPPPVFANDTRNSEPRTLEKKTVTTNNRVHDEKNQTCLSELLKRQTFRKENHFSDVSELDSNFDKRSETGLDKRFVFRNREYDKKMPVGEDCPSKSVFSKTVNQKPISEKPSIKSSGFPVKSQDYGAVHPANLPSYEKTSGNSSAHDKSIVKSHDKPSGKLYDCDKPFQVKSHDYDRIIKSSDYNRSSPMRLFDNDKAALKPGQQKSQNNHYISPGSPPRSTKGHKERSPENPFEDRVKKDETKSCEKVIFTVKTGKRFPLKSPLHDEPPESLDTKSYKWKNSFETIYHQKNDGVKMQDKSVNDTVVNKLSKKSSFSNSPSSERSPVYDQFSLIKSPPHEKILKSPTHDKIIKSPLYSKSCEDYQPKHPLRTSLLDGPLPYIDNDSEEESAKTENIADKKDDIRRKIREKLESEINVVHRVGRSQGGALRTLISKDSEKSPLKPDLSPQDKSPNKVQKSPTIVNKRLSLTDTDDRVIPGTLLPDTLNGKKNPSKLLLEAPSTSNSEKKMSASSLSLQLESHLQDKQTSRNSMKDIRPLSASDSALFKTPSLEPSKKSLDKKPKTSIQDPRLAASNIHDNTVNCHSKDPRLSLNDIRPRTPFPAVEKKHSSPPSRSPTVNDKVAKETINKDTIEIANKTSKILPSLTPEEIKRILMKNVHILDDKSNPEDMRHSIATADESKLCKILDRPGVKNIDALKHLPYIGGKNPSPFSPNSMHFQNLDTDMRVVPGKLTSNDIDMRVVPGKLSNNDATRPSLLGKPNMAPKKAPLLPHPFPQDPGVPGSPFTGSDSNFIMSPVYEQQAYPHNQLRTQPMHQRSVTPGLLSDDILMAPQAPGLMSATQPLVPSLIPQSRIPIPQPEHALAPQPQPKPPSLLEFSMPQSSPFHPMASPYREENAHVVFPNRKYAVSMTYDYNHSQSNLHFNQFGNMPGVNQPVNFPPAPQYEDMNQHYPMTVPRKESSSGVSERDPRMRHDTSRRSFENTNLRDFDSGRLDWCPPSPSQYENGESSYTSRNTIDNRVFSRPKTPIDRDIIRPKTPVDREFNRSKTPVDREFNRPKTPIDREFNRPKTPIDRGQYRTNFFSDDRERCRSKTPIDDRQFRSESRELSTSQARFEGRDSSGSRTPGPGERRDISRPKTPVREFIRPKTPIARRDSRPRTPFDTQRRGSREYPERGYTGQRGRDSFDSKRNRDERKGKAPSENSDVDSRSPLCSLYGAVTIPKTGKGYGDQKYRIPKKTQTPKVDDKPSEEKPNVSVEEEKSQIIDDNVKDDNIKDNNMKDDNTEDETVEENQAVKEVKEVLKKSKAKSEEKSKLKSGEKSKPKSEEKSKAKTEEKSKPKSEDKSNLEFEEKSKAKSEEKSKAKTEEKFKAKIEEKSKAKTEEKSKTKSEQKSKPKSEEVGKVVDEPASSSGADKHLEQKQEIDKKSAELINSELQSNLTQEVLTQNIFEVLKKSLESLSKEKLVEELLFGKFKLVRKDSDSDSDSDNHTKTSKNKSRMKDREKRVKESDREKRSKEREIERTKVTDEKGLKISDNKKHKKGKYIRQILSDSESDSENSRSKLISSESNSSQETEEGSVKSEVHKSSKHHHASKKKSRRTVSVTSEFSDSVSDISKPQSDNETVTENESGFSEHKSERKHKHKKRSKHKRDKSRKKSGFQIKPDVIIKQEIISDPEEDTYTQEEEETEENCEEETESFTLSSESSPKKYRRRKAIEMLQDEVLNFKLDTTSAMLSQRSCRAKVAYDVDKDLYDEVDIGEANEKVTIVDTANDIQKNANSKKKRSRRRRSKKDYDFLKDETKASAYFRKMKKTLGRRPITNLDEEVYEEVRALTNQVVEDEDFLDFIFLYSRRSNRTLLDKKIGNEINNIYRNKNIILKGNMLDNILTLNAVRVKVEIADDVKTEVMSSPSSPAPEPFDELQQGETAEARTSSVNEDDTSPASPAGSSRSFGSDDLEPLTSLKSSQPPSTLLNDEESEKKEGYIEKSEPVSREESNLQENKSMKNGKGETAFNNSVEKDAEDSLSLATDHSNIAVNSVQASETEDDGKCFTSSSSTTSEQLQDASELSPIKIVRKFIKSKGKSKKKKTKWQYGIIKKKSPVKHKFGMADIEDTAGTSHLESVEATADDVPSDINKFQSVENITEDEGNSNSTINLIKAKSKTDVTNKGKPETDFPKEYFTDRNYAFKENQSFLCKLCNFHGSRIVNHYKTVHPNAEVSISRLEEKEAEDALKEAKKLKFSDCYNSDEMIALSLSFKDISNPAFGCRICKKFKSSTFSLFFDHITIHTGEYRYSCSVCSYSCSCRKLVRKHIQSQHADIKGVVNVLVLYEMPAIPPDCCLLIGYMCSLCNFVQLQKSSARKHVMEMHTEDSNAKVICINMSLNTNLSKITGGLGEDVEEDEEQEVEIADVHAKQLNESSSRECLSSNLSIDANNVESSDLMKMTKKLYVTVEPLNMPLQKTYVSQEDTSSESQEQDNMLLDKITDSESETGVTPVSNVRNGEESLHSKDSAVKKDENAHFMKDSSALGLGDSKDGTESTEVLKKHKNKARGSERPAPLSIKLKKMGMRKEMVSSDLYSCKSTSAASKKFGREKEESELNEQENIEKMKRELENKEKQKREEKLELEDIIKKKEVEQKRKEMERIEQLKREEKERIDSEERERKEKQEMEERMERERQERIEREERERQERIEKEERERQERLEREERERQERIEREERERQERIKQEERKRREKEELERQMKEEKERQEKEEKERKERQAREEKERREREERERLEKEEREKREKEEKERREKEELERLHKVLGTKSKWCESLPTGLDTSGIKPQHPIIEPASRTAKELTSWFSSTLNYLSSFSEKPAEETLLWKLEKRSEEPDDDVIIRARENEEITLNSEAEFNDLEMKYRQLQLKDDKLEGQATENVLNKDESKEKKYETRELLKMNKTSQLSCSDESNDLIFRMTTLNKLLFSSVSRSPGLVTKNHNVSPLGDKTCTSGNVKAQESRVESIPPNAISGTPATRPVQQNTLSDFVFFVGPLQAKRVKGSAIVYRCYVNDCQFISYVRKDFMYHVKSIHKDKEWSGSCYSCGDVNIFTGEHRGQGNYPLNRALKHLFEDHLVRLIKENSAARQVADEPAPSCSSSASDLSVGEATVDNSESVETTDTEHVSGFGSIRIESVVSINPEQFGEQKGDTENQDVTENSSVAKNSLTNESDSSSNSITLYGSDSYRSLAGYEQMPIILPPSVRSLGLEQLSCQEAAASNLPAASPQKLILSPVPRSLSGVTVIGSSSEVFKNPRSIISPVAISVGTTQKLALYPSPPRLTAVSSPTVGSTSGLNAITKSPFKLVPVSSQSQITSLAPSRLTYIPTMGPLSPKKTVVSVRTPASPQKTVVISKNISAKKSLVKILPKPPGTPIMTSVSGQLFALEQSSPTLVGIDLPKQSDSRTNKSGEANVEQEKYSLAASTEKSFSDAFHQLRHVMKAESAEAFAWKTACGVYTVSLGRYRTKGMISDSLEFIENGSEELEKFLEQLQGSLNNPTLPSLLNKAIEQNSIADVTSQSLVSDSNNSELSSQAKSVASSAQHAPMETGSVSEIPSLKDIQDTTAIENMSSQEDSSSNSYLTALLSKPVTDTASSEMPSIISAITQNSVTMANGVTEINMPVTTNVASANSQNDILSLPVVSSASVDNSKSLELIPSVSSGDTSSDAASLDIYPNEISKPDSLYASPNQAGRSFSSPCTDYVLFKGHFLHKSLVAPIIVKHTKGNLALRLMSDSKKLVHLYKCMSRICTFTTNTKSSFILHFNVHSIVKTNEETLDFHRCPYCCTVHPSITEYIEHIDKEHSHCNYQCSYCFFRAASQCFVLLHQNTHHKNQKPSVLFCQGGSTPPLPDAITCLYDSAAAYKCTEGSCNKSFFDVTAFLAHLKESHADENSYHCHICRESFPMQDLVKHYSKKYHCLYCKKSASQENEIHAHLYRRHPNQRCRAVERVKKDGDTVCEYLSSVSFHRETTFTDSIVFPPDEFTEPPTFSSKDSHDFISDILKVSPAIREKFLSMHFKEDLDVKKTRKAIGNLAQDESMKKDSENVPTNQGINSASAETSAREENKDSESAVLASVGDSNTAVQITENGKEKHGTITDMDKPAVVADDSATCSTKTEDASFTRVPAVVDLTADSDYDSDVEVVSCVIMKKYMEIINLCEEEEKDFKNSLSLVKAEESDSAAATDTNDKSAAVAEENPSEEVRKPDAGDLNKNSNVISDDDLDVEIIDSEATEDSSVQGDTSSLHMESEDSNTQDSNLQKSSKGSELSGSDLYVCGNTQCTYRTHSSSFFKNHSLICDFGRHTRGLVCAHCSKICKNLTNLLSHLMMHGVKRYHCDICNYKAPKKQIVIRHMKRKHKLSDVVVQAKDPFHTNPETAVFIIRSKRRANLSKKLTARSNSDVTVIDDDQSVDVSDKEKSSSNDGATKYGPDDIAKVPDSPIFTVTASCALCPFKTTVQKNFIRHLKMHELKPEKEAVPSKQPVNPMPCLENQVMMFDKMVNLAASSYYAGGAPGPKRPQDYMPTPEEEELIPKYVPPNQRYVCGVEGCYYVSHDQLLLKYHVRALHFNETEYTCPHCPAYDTSSTMPMDKMATHLKMHAGRLYKCVYCPHCHFQKHTMEKHISDKHAGHLCAIFIVRDSEDSVEEALPVYKVIIVNKEPALDKKSDKASPKLSWTCGFCDFKCCTRGEVVSHASNKHGQKSQYRCSLCSFKSSAKLSMATHFSLKHPGSTVSIEHAYKKMKPECLTDVTKEDSHSPIKDQSQPAVASAVPNLPPPPPPPVTSISDDTNPLWKRNWKEGCLRSIRGILLDEDADKISIPADLRKAVGSSTNKYGPLGKPSDDKRFVCPLCNKHTTLKEDMKFHLLIELESKKWACSHCGFSSFFRTEVQRHSITHEKEGLKQSLVPVPPDEEMENWVDQVVETQAMLMKNVPRALPSTISEQSPVKSIDLTSLESASTVPVTPDISTDNSNLTVPETTQEEIQTLNVRVASATAPPNARLHSDSAAGASTGSKFWCKSCPLNFTTIKGLKIHVRINHLKLARYQCPHCDVVSNHESAVVNHCIKAHPSATPHALYNEKYEALKVDSNYWKTVYGFDESDGETPKYSKVKTNSAKYRKVEVDKWKKDSQTLRAEVAEPVKSAPAKSPRKYSKQKPQSQNIRKVETTQAVQQEKSSTVTEQCEYCDFHGDLNNHLPQHGIVRIITCLSCLSRVFFTDSQSSIEQHFIDTHHCDPFYCWKIIENEPNVDSKKQKVGNVNTSQIGFDEKLCFYCNEVVRTKNISIHCRQKHTRDFPRTAYFVCPTCSYRTLSLESCRVHIRNVHLNENKNPENSDACNPSLLNDFSDQQDECCTYSCTLCAFKTDCSSNLIEHIKTCHNENFACQECFKTFSVHQEAVNHFRYEHPHVWIKIADLRHSNVSEKGNNQTAANRSTPLPQKRPYPFDNSEVGVKANAMEKNYVAKKSTGNLRIAPQNVLLSPDSATTSSSLPDPTLKRTLEQQPVSRGLYGSSKCVDEVVKQKNYGIKKAKSGFHTQEPKLQTSVSEIKLHVAKKSTSKPNSIGRSLPVARKSTSFLPSRDAEKIQSNPPPRPDPVPTSPSLELPVPSAATVTSPLPRGSPVAKKSTGGIPFRNACPSPFRHFNGSLTHPENGSLLTNRNQTGQNKNNTGCSIENYSAKSDSGSDNTKDVNASHSRNSVGKSPVPVYENNSFPNLSKLTLKAKCLKYRRNIKKNMVFSTENGLMKVPTIMKMYNMLPVVVAPKVS